MGILSDFTFNELDRNTAESFLVQYKTGVLSNLTTVDNSTILHIACKYGDYDTVLYVLKNSGIDINDNNNWHGESPIIPMLETFNCNLNVLKLLLENGANPNLPDKDGNTAMFSVRSLPPAQLLIKFGGDINIVNIRKENPLHGLIFWRDKALDTLKYFASLEPSLINKPDKLGYTPFLLACNDCAYESVQILISEGADLSYKSPSYGNAVNVSARKGCDKVLKLLLEKGIDINTEGSCTFPPLHGAAISGSAACVKLLLQYGADPALKSTRNGKSPLDVASGDEVRALLLSHLTSKDKDRMDLKIKQASDLIEKLDQLGYFKYDSPQDVEKNKADIKESYLRRKIIETNYDLYNKPLNKRTWHLDAENLAEGDVEVSLKLIGPVLKLAGVPDPVIDTIESEDNYIVSVNGKQYSIFSSPGSDDWTKASISFARITNDLLQSANSDEKLYLHYPGSNDTSCVFLTKELFDYFKTLDLDKRWMPVDADSLL